MTHTKEHQSLRQLLADHSYWIYTDGSAKTTGIRAGSYAAMILEEGAAPLLVAGACNETTVNRMELLAINSALRRVFDLLGGAVHGVKVTIVTDSQITQRAIIGENKRNANLDIWAQFDVLCMGFEEITVLHKERNTEAPQAQADAICDFCRKIFEDLVLKIIKSEQFAGNEITRKTKFRDADDKNSNSEAVGGGGEDCSRESGPPTGGQDPG
jgi:ribonuclease HI